MKVWINDFFVNKEAMKAIDRHWGTKTKTLGNNCPDCNAPLVHQEACLKCSNPACGMEFMLNVKYISSDLFKSENKHICEQLSKDKYRVYCVIKSKGIAYVAISPAKAIEMGLLVNNTVPPGSRTYGWGHRSINVKKIKTQGLGYGLTG